MKTWIAFGWIFTFIGFIALILGLGQIARIYDVVNHAGVNYSSSIISTLIWSAFASYFAGCIVFFVIGGVGFVAGRDSKSNIEVPLMNEASKISKTMHLFWANLR